MTGWSFFFILVGVVSLTVQLFRIIDAIERPTRRAHRRAEHPADRGRHTGFRLSYSAPDPGII